MPDHPETTASDKVATNGPEHKPDESDRYRSSDNRDLDAIEGGAGLAELDRELTPSQVRDAVNIMLREPRRRPDPGMPARHAVLLEVLGERAKQDRKWGEQNHRSVRLARLITSADRARAVCDAAFRIERNPGSAEKLGTWEDIAVEELAEAIDAKDEQERRAELVQCAAVLVAWIECIDRRANGGKVSP